MSGNITVLTREAEMTINKIPVFILSQVQLISFQISLLLAFHPLAIYFFFFFTSVFHFGNFLFCLVITTGYNQSLQWNNSCRRSQSVHWDFSLLLLVSHAFHVPESLRWVVTLPWSASSGLFIPSFLVLHPHSSFTFSIIFSPFLNMFSQRYKCLCWCAQLCSVVGPVELVGTGCAQHRADTSLFSLKSGL